MPLDRDRAYLVDILESARLALRYVTDISEEDFFSDVRSQDAVLRRLEIIGEAARRLSQETREAYPQVPWQRMYSMRNFLIHQYDSVDLQVVWDTVGRDLASLISTLEAIVGQQE